MGEIDGDLRTACLRLESCAGVSADDAPDVCQEVFRAVSRDIAGFQHNGQSGFRAWLRTITKHRVSDHFTALRRSPRGVGGTDPQMALGEIAEPAALDNDDSKPHETVRLLHLALHAIRGDFQEATWLVFWRSAIEGQETGRHRGRSPHDPQSSPPSPAPSAEAAARRTQRSARLDACVGTHGRPSSTSRREKVRNFPGMLEYFDARWRFSVREQKNCNVIMNSCAMPNMHNSRDFQRRDWGPPESPLGVAEPAPFLRRRCCKNLVGGGRCGRLSGLGCSAFFAWRTLAKAIVREFAVMARLQRSYR